MAKRGKLLLSVALARVLGRGAVLPFTQVAVMFLQVHKCRVLIGMKAKHSGRDSTEAEMCLLIQSRSSILEILFMFSFHVKFWCEWNRFAILNWFLRYSTASKNWELKLLSNKPLLSTIVMWKTLNTLTKVYPYHYAEKVTQEVYYSHLLSSHF